MSAYDYEMCNCGHFGGVSPDSHNGHDTRFQKGHGKCKNCECNQFTWIGFVNSKGKIL
jgi:hypothetical protein